MKNKLMFVLWDLLLMLSTALVVYCFFLADQMRPVDSTGGEVFMIALPLWIMCMHLKTSGRK